MTNPLPTSDAINDKHLTLVQGVINRLAGNSFALKGWSVTLVSALLALAARDADTRLVAVALLPALTFWGLDGYFLAQERLFRGLYDKLIDPGRQIPAFSMRTEKFTAALWSNATFSLTLVPFHGTVVAAILGVLAYVGTGQVPPSTAGP
ncbi:MAG: hypothetical protein WCA32_06665 [Chromatiaceae bacterium]